MASATVSGAGILALGAAGPRSPQRQLSALPSLPHGDLIPERTLCVPQAQKGAQAQTEEYMLVLGEGQAFPLRPEGVWGPGPRPRSQAPGDSPLEPSCSPLSRGPVPRPRGAGRRFA